MKDNKKRLFILIASILIMGIGVYSLLVSHAGSPPGNDEILAEINGEMHEASVNDIQDFLLLDSRHGAAPFRTDTGEYGMSYWKWSITGWKLKGYTTKGEPRLWKVHQKDPSSYHIVWNIDPEEEVSKLAFYYIKERGYFGDGEKERYYPNIQMKREVSLKKKSYGVLKIPKNWMEATKEAFDENGSSNAFFHTNLYSTFAWVPLDASGERKSGYREGNGSSYYQQIQVEYMKLISAGELQLGID
ncbi:hypothetical protein [Bacillus sp. KH172YL63]|uniref:hypothetical protein n=1 Tax=Bacillus sp. KH172YL63 TaxID=2709784 RepID=UPI0013E4F047|nr:hypothetical protein [Bacillus sp. KH172YL63]BCB04216.1 hypothetical protein KH172YL63_23490 [Bacillus sp. KH172YL63]